MLFTPRLTCPGTDSPYWKLTSAGGYNKCITGSHINSKTYRSALPNCVGYAYGRFMEVLGESKCKLSTGNAGTWYMNTGDGYERGQTPRVGAVMCWSKPGHAGHVAIVEEVRSDGSILTSESGWGFPWGERFWTMERTNANGIWGAQPPYQFQGFIYNPNVADDGVVLDKSKSFTDEAMKHVGEGPNWTWSAYGQFNIEWCAAFVSAVAKTVGILDKCIYNTASAPELARQSVASSYGLFYLGPGQGRMHVPAVGDLVFFRWTSRSRTDKYDCDHVAIVVDVTNSGSQIITVEGNTGTNDKFTSSVKKKTYSISSTSISGYFHPNWAIVGSSDTQRYVMNGELYESRTTRKDMTVREIGYLDNRYQPSIQSSSIKLSVINYTGVLAAAFKLVAPQSTQVASANTDKLRGNCKIIVNYLIDKGLNGAAACGIAGNIFHESSFDTSAVGDYGTSFGICQWHLNRGTAMKKMAGTGWANNLTGQLDYLWYELTTSYYSTLTALKSTSNDVTGCKKAADVFVRQFERPSDVDIKSVQRQSTASSYFEQIINIEVET